MKKAIGWLGFVVLLSPSYQEWSDSLLSLDYAESTIGTTENPQARAEFEFLKIRNPQTGTVPVNIRQKEIAFSRQHPSRLEMLAQRGNVENEEVWTSVGPYNVGGRTRAVALDISDPSENTLIAGGVSGGIWKSTNGGVNWLRTSDPENRNSITTLAQDIRAGSENVWYYGTGELLGNSPIGGGAPYRGDGLFKSTDSGDSWVQLASTKDAEPSVFGSQFQYIWRVVTNENRTDADELFLATYGGVLRSEDGGDSWVVELGEDLNNLPSGTDLNESLAPFYTEVAKNGEGHFYASLSHSTSSDQLYPNAGFFWSENGDDWFDISFPDLSLSELSRTVISVKGNVAYFFSNQEEFVFLFKYEFSGTNGAGMPMGIWTDLTENLPDFEDIGELNIQLGFNMTIQIDPTNPTTVFLGGTNLYRSTDGFASTNNTDWIGGYADSENVSLYDNHHPDQHEVIFFPSMPNKMLSANDGGLYVTQNNSAAEVQWSSLNNGYVTSQFYTINIPKSEENDIILGGLQDNGSHINVSDNENAPWVKVLGGDGAYTATGRLGLYWYFSFQNSQIYRLSFNKNLDLTAFARVDPTGGATLTDSEYLFINPYVLDPNNPNIMYLAGGNAIWRNSNLAQIPSGSQETTSVNWDLLTTTVLTDDIITSLEITHDSKYFYYGTSNGRLYRLEEPSIKGEESLIQIQQTNSPNAYVSCIAGNPEEESEILTIYSNYQTSSIFHSSDAGETFEDVSGNLEEFPDGSGNGPSVRWAEIVPLESGTRYFVGTSTGLYSTGFLNGTSTIWAKESTDKIGKSVVMMMDYRPLDGRFVVSTHGNGVFKTTINGFKRIAPTNQQAQKFTVSNSFPNPFSDVTRIEFEIPETKSLKVDIFDMFGKHVRNLFIGPQYAGKNVISWDGQNQHGEPVEDGMYIYRIFYDGQVVGGRMVFYNR